MENDPDDVPIQMAIINSKLLVYQRVFELEIM